MSRRSPMTSEQQSKAVHDFFTIHTALRIEQRDRIDSAKHQLRLVPRTLECLADATKSEVGDALIFVAAAIRQAVAEIDDEFAAADKRGVGGAR